MNVLVFQRGKAGPGSRPVCRQPVFPADQGADENSLISVPGGLIAENNYGYALKTLALRQPTTVPGLVKIRVDYRDGGCRIAWSNDTARVPSSVSKASLGSGLVYAYTHPAADELAYRVPLPLGSSPRTRGTSRRSRSAPVSRSGAGTSAQGSSSTTTTPR